MGMTIDPLPADLGRLDRHAVAAAERERRDLLAAIFEQAGPDRDMSKVTVIDGDSKAKVDQLKALDRDLSRLQERREPTAMVHPTPPGSSAAGQWRPGDYGRVEGLGSAFLKQLGRGNNGDTRAALDATSGGATMPGSFWDSRLQDMPTRQLFIRSLIPSRQTTFAAVDYVRQTVQTLAATAVSAGSAKPVSTLSAERVTTPVRVIAHVSEALDRSLLSDYDQLTNFIDQQMRLGVLLEEERQILLGDGTAPNLSGILDQSIQSQAKSTDPTPDAIMKAMTKVRQYYFEPDGVVLHPADWQEIALLATADGIYLFGSPNDEAQPTLWGKKVITSPVMTQGTGLVGNFGSAQIYEREGVRITFSETGLGDSSEEMFTHNLVRWRAESRLALAIPFPNAFCKITGI